MAAFQWQDLIDRARLAVDDDHGDGDSWIAPARWLEIGFTERQKLYRRALRDGLVDPDPSTAYLQGARTTVTGVLAIIGVAQDLGSSVRMLENAASARGRLPYFRGSSAMTGHSTSWAGRGTGDNLVIELDPQPSDLTYNALATPPGNYFCRYIPVLTPPTAVTDTVELPDGGDEALILRMARRSHVKDSLRSALLEQLIQDADAEMKFTAAGKVGGLKVRRTPPARGSRFNATRLTTWPGPLEWRFY